MRSVSTVIVAGCVVFAFSSDCPLLMILVEVIALNG